MSCIKSCSACACGTILGILDGNEYVVVFNVKVLDQVYLTRIAGVAYNKYKMADASRVAGKSQLISMLSQRVRVGTPDTRLYHLLKL